MENDEELETAAASHNDSTPKSDGRRPVAPKIEVGSRRSSNDGGSRRSSLVEVSRRPSIEGGSRRPSLRFDDEAVILEMPSSMPDTPGIEGVNVNYDALYTLFDELAGDDDIITPQELHTFMVAHGHDVPLQTLRKELKSFGIQAKVGICKMDFVRFLRDVMVQKGDDEPRIEDVHTSSDSDGQSESEDNGRKRQASISASSSRRPRRSSLMGTCTSGEEWDGEEENEHLKEMLRQKDEEEKELDNKINRLKTENVETMEELIKEREKSEAMQQAVARLESERQILFRQLQERRLSLDSIQAAMVPPNQTQVPTASCLNNEILGSLEMRIQEMSARSVEEVEALFNQMPCILGAIFDEKSARLQQALEDRMECVQEKIRSQESQISQVAQCLDFLAPIPDEIKRIADNCSGRSGSKPSISVLHDTLEAQHAGETSSGAEAVTSQSPSMAALRDVLEELKGCGANSDHIVAIRFDTSAIMNFLTSWREAHDEAAARGSNDSEGRSQSMQKVILESIRELREGLWEQLQSIVPQCSRERADAKGASDQTSTSSTLLENALRRMEVEHQRVENLHSAIHTELENLRNAKETHETLMAAHQAGAAKECRQAVNVHEAILAELEAWRHSREKGLDAQFSSLQNQLAQLSSTFEHGSACNQSRGFSSEALLSSVEASSDQIGFMRKELTAVTRGIEALLTAGSSAGAGASAPSANTVVDHVRDVLQSSAEATMEQIDLLRKELSSITNSIVLSVGAQNDARKEAHLGTISDFAELRQMQADVKEGLMQIRLAAAEVCDEHASVGELVKALSSDVASIVTNVQHLQRSEHATSSELPGRSASRTFSDVQIEQIKADVASILGSLQRLRLPEDVEFSGKDQSLMNREQVSNECIYAIIKDGLEDLRSATAELRAHSVAASTGHLELARRTFADMMEILHAWLREGKKEAVVVEKQQDGMEPQFVETLEGNIGNGLNRLLAAADSVGEKSLSANSTMTSKPHGCLRAELAAVADANCDSNAQAPTPRLVVGAPPPGMRELRRRRLPSSPAGMAIEDSARFAMAASTANRSSGQPSPWVANRSALGQRLEGVLPRRVPQVASSTTSQCGEDVDLSYPCETSGKRIANALSDASFLKELGNLADGLRSGLLDGKSARNYLLKHISGVSDSTGAASSLESMTPRGMDGMKTSHRSRAFEKPFLSAGVIVIERSRTDRADDARCGMNTVEAGLQSPRSVDVMHPQRFPIVSTGQMPTHPSKRGLLVTTPFSDTTGLYMEQCISDGFPAFQRQGLGPPMWLYKQLGLHWAIGEKLGGAEACHAATGSSSQAHSPDLAAWLDVEIVESKNVEASPVPLMLRVTSSYPDLDGGYLRAEEDYDYYPVFAGGRGGHKILWHARAQHLWVLSESAGDIAAYNAACSDHADPSLVPVSAWDIQPFVVESIQWDGFDPNDAGFFDLEFPADSSSVDLAFRPQLHHWIRAPEVLTECIGRPSSLGEVYWRACGLKPGCPARGLSATIAAVAEFPHAVKQRFQQWELSCDGRYEISLYDVRLSAWLSVVIDDKIPCGTTGSPLFARPRGDGLWVLLLEKAIAKFIGAYSGLLSSVEPSFFFQILTGIERQKCYRRGVRSGWRGWCKCVLDVTQQKVSMETDRVACPFRLTSQFLTEFQLHEHVGTWLATDYPVCAAVSAIDSEDGQVLLQHGLARGCVYPIVGTVELSGRRFFEVRGPDLQKDSSATDCFRVSVEDFAHFFDTIYVSPGALHVARRALCQDEAVSVRTVNDVNVAQKLYVKDRSPVPRDDMQPIDAIDCAMELKVEVSSEHDTTAAPHNNPLTAVGMSRAEMVPLPHWHELHMDLDESLTRLQIQSTALAELEADNDRALGPNCGAVQRNLANLVESIVAQSDTNCERRERSEGPASREPKLLKDYDEGTLREQLVQMRLLPFHGEMSSLRCFNVQPAEVAETGPSDWWTSVVPAKGSELSSAVEQDPGDCNSSVASKKELVTSTVDVESIRASVSSLKSVEILSTCLAPAVSEPGNTKKVTALSSKQPVKSSWDTLLSESLTSDGDVYESQGAAQLAVGPSRAHSQLPLAIPLWRDGPEPLLVSPVGRTRSDRFSSRGPSKPCLNNQTLTPMATALIEGHSASLSPPRQVRRDGVLAPQTRKYTLNPLNETSQSSSPSTQVQRNVQAFPPTSEKGEQIPSSVSTSSNASPARDSEGLEESLWWQQQQQELAKEAAVLQSLLDLLPEPLRAQVPHVDNQGPSLACSSGGAYPLGLCLARHDQQVNVPQAFSPPSSRRAPSQRDLGVPSPSLTAKRVTEPVALLPTDSPPSMSPSGTCPIASATPPCATPPAPLLSGLSRWTCAPLQMESGGDRIGAKLPSWPTSQSVSFRPEDPKPPSPRGRRYAAPPSPPWNTMPSPQGSPRCIDPLTQ